MIHIVIGTEVRFPSGPTGQGALGMAGGSAEKLMQILGGGNGRGHDFHHFLPVDKMETAKRSSCVLVCKPGPCAPELFLCLCDGMVKPVP